jgi:hypothetical protein
LDIHKYMYMQSKIKIFIKDWWLQIKFICFIKDVFFGFINYDTYMSWSCQWSLMSLIQSLNFSKFFCWLCPFLFHNTLACVFFITLLPVIEFIKDHWHGPRHSFVKPSCGTVALYGPFGFLRYGRLSMNNLGWSL